MGARACGRWISRRPCGSQHSAQRVRGGSGRVRQVLVVGRLDEEGLGGEVVGGAPGQQISGQSPPGKLVVLGVRDLVVASLCDNALVQAQEVNVLVGNLGLAVQNGPAASVSMRAWQLWQLWRRERAPSLLVVLGQRLEELVVFLGTLDRRFRRLARRHGAVRALIQGKRARLAGPQSQ